MTLTANEATAHYIGDFGGNGEYDGIGEGIVSSLPALPNWCSQHLRQGLGEKYLDPVWFVPDAAYHKAVL